MSKKLILLGIIALILTGCSSNNSNALKIGMECNYAPYNWSEENDSNGGVIIKNVEGMYCNGYDVMVAKNIAESLNKELEIYAYEWNSLVPAVESGTLDLIIAGMSPTPERREKIDFTDNYYYSNLVVITKNNKLNNVKKISDLNGLRIGAQSGTSHYDVLKEQTKAKITEFEDFSLMLVALKAGTIDGYVAEEPTALLVSRDKNFKYIPFINNENGFKVNDYESSIAIGIKNDSKLKDSINNYLKTFNTESQNTLMKDMIKYAPK